MAEPESRRYEFDEPQIACGGLVVSSGDAPSVLDLVDASFDQIAQSVQEAVDGLRVLAGPSGWDDRRPAALRDVFTDVVRVVPPIGHQDLRLWQIIIHHSVISAIIRNLTGRDLGLHGQAASIREEVDLGREATL